MAEKYIVQAVKLLGNDRIGLIDYRQNIWRCVAFNRCQVGSNIYYEGFDVDNEKVVVTSSCKCLCLSDLLVRLYGNVNVSGSRIYGVSPEQCVGCNKSLFNVKSHKNVLVVECLAFPSLGARRFVRLDEVTGCAFVYHEPTKPFFGYFYVPSMQCWVLRIRGLDQHVSYDISFYEHGVFMPLNKVSVGYLTFKEVCMADDRKV